MRKNVLAIIILLTSCGTTIQVVRDVHKVKKEYIQKKDPIYEQLLVNAALSHPKTDVREASIVSLGDIKNKKANEALFKIALEKNGSDFSIALKTIKENGLSEDFKAKFFNAVEKGKVKEEKVIETLKTLGYREGGPILKKYIEQGTFVDESIDALGYVEGGEDILIELLNKKNLETEYKVKVISSLGRRKNSEKAYKALLKLIK